MKRVLTAIFLAATTPTITAADSHNTQLVLLVQNGIARYGIHADVSNLSTSALAQLKGILDRKGTYLRKRNEIRTVLRNNGFNT